MTILDVLNDEVLPDFQASQAVVEQADRLMRGGPALPNGYQVSPRDEKIRIRELSHTSLLALIVEYTAQQLVVEGVSDGSGDLPSVFQPFIRNGMPSRQGALHKAVLSYGEAYGLALPEALRPATLTGSGAFMQAFAPGQFGVIFDDPAVDEFPRLAWRRGTKNGEDTFLIWDDRNQHELYQRDGQWKLRESVSHGFDRTPVVRFTNDPDLSGAAFGEPVKYQWDVERHSKTVDDRLRIQHYNSWRVKYAVKLADNLTPEEERQARLKLEQEDILLGYDDTEFGTLEQTDLAPMISAQDTDRDTLAAVSQTPVWAFNGGSMVNLSADALVEAKSGNRQKVWNIQRGLNRPYCNWLRLAAQAEDRLADAENFDLMISWADIGSLSLSAAADALGKLAVNLGIPQDELWEMIPGVPFQKINAWRERGPVLAADAAALVDVRRGANTEG